MGVVKYLLYRRANIVFVYVTMGSAGIYPVWIEIYTLIGFVDLPIQRYQ